MTEKENKEEKEQEKETDEIIESEDESGLEENLEEAETNIDENKFQDVMVNINSKSPSLEQVAIAPKNLTSLEVGLAEAPLVKEDKEGVEYSAINYNEKKEKSYAENVTAPQEDLIVSSSGSIAKQNLRETIQTDKKQAFQINPELQKMQTSQQDDYAVKVPTDDFKETKTQDPFQKSTKEYEFR